MRNRDEKEKLSGYAQNPKSIWEWIPMRKNYGEIWKAMTKLQKISS